MSGLIAYRNLADTATVALTAGAIAEFPVANLATRQLARVCRMTAAATPAITIDLGSAQRTDVIALLNINATSAATSSMLIQYGSDGISWTNLITSVPADAGVPSLPNAVILAHGITANYRYWKVTPQWTRKGGATYYEIGRLWLGPAITLENGFEGRWRNGFLDRGRLDESAGLQNYADVRVRARTLSLRCEVDTSLAYGFAHDATSALDVPCFQGLQMECGTTGEVIAVPRTETRLWQRRLALYGHLQSDFGIDKAAGPNYSVDLVIQEER